MISTLLGCDLSPDLGPPFSVNNRLFMHSAEHSRRLAYSRRAVRYDMVVRRPSRNLPLKLSMKTFCVGLHGWMKASVTFRSSAHKNIGLLVSCGPLSQTIETGRARCCVMSSRNRARRRPEMDMSTSWPTHSRLKSSTVLSTRKRRPDAS